MSVSYDVIAAVRSRFARDGCSQPKQTVVLRFAGDLDLSTAAVVQAQLEAAQSRRVAAILLDLSDVNFIDAHSIGLIVAAWAYAKDHGRVLRVVGLHDMPARLFSMLGLDRLSGAPASDDDGGGDPDARS
jgi:anti-anti-sigma factor